MVGYADYLPASQVNGPTEWATVTPSDSVNFTRVPRGLFIGGAGNIVVVDGAANTMTIAVTASQIIAIQPVRVNSTNTTATGIKALY